MQQLQPGHRVWARVAMLAAAVVITAHGLVHLMSVSLLWKLGEPGQLRYADVAPAPGTVAGYLAGSLWLVAVVLFVMAAVLLVMGRPWRLAALPGGCPSRARTRTRGRPA
jgi:hypothetical protein